MQLFELVLVLLLTGAVLTVIAQRIGTPYPALLAVAGAALALLPTGADPGLDPELALALFVAPTLMDAAFDASPRDLKANWRPVTSLVLIAVGVTVIAVAIVARLLVPDMPWAVAIALGAIVAPPDASAATAVLRQLSPPHRVMVILEGESLLNDASALLIYRVALSAVAGGAFSIWMAGWLLLVTCLGGAVLGFVTARLYLLLVRPAHDIAVSVVTQFVGTFAVWILAERLGVSPVITTVFYAITIARLAPGRLGAEHRRASYAVWEVAVFVLNALAFILIGLQLRGVLERLHGHAAEFAIFAGSILLTCVLARMAWVMGFTTLMRKFSRNGTMRAPANGAFVVSWCGMRGIVTLATALALPVAVGDTPAFPYRDLLVAAAFAVVLGTLVIQGVTLAPLLRWMRLDDDGAITRELSLARHEVSSAALLVLHAAPGQHAAALLAEFEDAGTSQADRHNLTLQVIAAKRHRLLELRRSLVIGDSTFQHLEEELDWAEGHTLRRLRSAG
ncbi:sodium:proton antiporter [Acidisphaera sp. L21]|uniref:cation:proton antiporter n=1 Tax=Acidisphaera sp. L21 TaxID=1641851 RepID=UPI00131A776A|nr:sodium:proton antiporter [Acidisphaera sp. L21]